MNRLMCDECGTIHDNREAGTPCLREYNKVVAPETTLGNLTLGERLPEETEVTYERKVCLGRLIPQGGEPFQKA